ncbi:hypothetical protein Cadr_000001337 [Camelus dromedarius]|uniref:Uncharacterized protein n=1 Tax=Camelus dromedarius TaxID=9838 RepID=A0A5N4EHK7_CAMDR|nr:hypothetical protein Cadr_000001337 [Camelus dromedarius]
MRVVIHRSVSVTAVPGSQLLPISEVSCCTVLNPFLDRVLRYTDWFKPIEAILNHVAKQEQGWSTEHLLPEEE